MQNTTALINRALIEKYDLSGPRYTSYPTATQFVDFQDTNGWQKIARKCDTNAPLSLYFHLPFCETVCYYCACNKIITANRKVASTYLKSLHKEIEMQADLLNQTREVTQLHWGGGTPTYISDDEMITLMDITHKHFNLLDNEDREFSIEVHPSGVNRERIHLLKTLGFNRISIGVQDFDKQVQKSVNRFNSEKEVSDIVNAIRKNAFKSISMDLIYGLPLQTVDSFSKTLNKIITLSPDRISLFNYAHMPHLFKTQRQIKETDLPSSNMKLNILQESIDQLTYAGYEYIGMDHFAKPNDELAIAQREGSLHRNFQGYSTKKSCDLLSFGISAINSLADSHIQNTKSLDEYHHMLKNNTLPIAKIINKNRDDIIRKSVIDALTCQFLVNFRQIEQQFGIHFIDYFQDELEQLNTFEKDDLLTVNKTNIHINTSGRLLIRRICMVFDRYIPKGEQPKLINYSKII